MSANRSASSVGSRLADCCQTTDCGPSMTAAATSSPRFAGRQWRKIASGLARRHELLGDLEGAQGGGALLAFALLAHRRPDVCVDRVGTPHCRGRIVDDPERSARDPREPFRIGQDALVRRVVGRTADRHVEPGEGCDFEQRVGDVVAAVADEREPTASSAAETLLDREHIGQCLAGVVLIGECVDDRHRRPARQLVDRFLRERPDHDRRDVARQRPRGVCNRLAAAELQLLRRQCDGRCPEARDRRCERDSRAGGRLLEDAGDRVPSQCPFPLARRGLHRLGEPEQVMQLLARQVGDAGEVRQEGVGARGAHTIPLLPWVDEGCAHRHHPVTTVSGWAVFASVTIGWSTCAIVGVPTSSSS